VQRLVEVCHARPHLYQAGDATRPEADAKLVHQAAKLVHLHRPEHNQQ
jgi:hypothetical protein